MATRVQFCTRHHPRLFLRQTPNGDGLWQDFQFLLDGQDCAADWAVVYDEPQGTALTTAPRERRILAVTEPPSLKRYPPEYLQQFGVAISPVALDGFGGVWIQRHGSNPWHFGVNWQHPDCETSAVPFSDLDAVGRADKRLEISVICSRKTKSEEHRRRIAFVHALKGLLGDRLHWYGRGMRPLGDKAEAIAPYRYHIALENNFVDHFWTEKIADAYLGLAFPFYSGCRNLHDYFDRDSFEYIDIDDPRRAAETIETAIADNLFETRLTRLQDARHKVLFDYNIFNETRNAIVALQPALEGRASLSAQEDIDPIEPGKASPQGWIKSGRRKNGIRGELVRALNKIVQRIWPTYLRRWPYSSGPRP